MREARLAGEVVAEEEMIPLVLLKMREVLVVAEKLESIVGR
jgi:hypothetical protein